MRKEIIELESKIVDNSKELNKEILKENLENLFSILRRSLLSEKESVWVYWQISDHLGLLRESERLAKVFQEFCSFVNRVGGVYVYMPICDSTQRLTLLLGGHYDMWYKQFDYALEKVQLGKTNQRILFEVIRSSIGIFTDDRVFTKRNRLTQGFALFEEFLSRNEDLDNYLYYKMIYYSLRIKAKDVIFFNLKEELYWIIKLVQQLDGMINNEETESYMFGSLEDWTLEQNPGVTSKVGITNLLFALLEKSEHKICKKVINNLKRYKITNPKLKNLMSIV